MGDVSAEPGIESVGEREGVWGVRVAGVCVAEVPFSKHAGGVSSGFEAFGEGDFVGMKVSSFGGSDDPTEAGAARVATGEEAVSGGGAGGRSRVKLGEVESFGGDFADGRSFDGGVSGVGEIGISGIVEEDHDDVGSIKGIAGGGKGKGEEKEEEKFHDQGGWGWLLVCGAVRGEADEGFWLEKGGRVKRDGEEDIFERVEGWGDGGEVGSDGGRGPRDEIGGVLQLVMIVE